MLIPYLGEKSKIASFITPYIPTDISTYVEPLGGMYGVFFSLDFAKYKKVKFIYNDQNKLNYLLFKKLKDKNFASLINETHVDESFYKSCFKNLIFETDENLLALYWLVILNCSSLYEISKPSWTSDSEFEIFKMKYPAYKYHLSRINKIHNLDYKEIIEMYDSESTFFYIDPPYCGYEKCYINSSFTNESHQELSDILNNIKGRFILSYSPFDGLEKLYPNCRMEPINNNKEVIIMNYDTEVKQDLNLE